MYSQLERNMDVKTDTETIPYNSIDATGDTTFCHGFGRKEIRHNFIKKVLVLFMTLCVSAISLKKYRTMSYLFYSVYQCNNFFIQN